MTPFESGMAACTAPAIPKAIPTSVRQSRSFLPSDRDESRFMTISFHERCGGRRPAAAGDRKNDLYRPRFYALCIPESTRPRPGVGLLKGLPGVWNRRGAAPTGASTRGGRHSDASLYLYTGIVSPAQLGQLARDG